MRLTFKEIKDQIGKIVPSDIEYIADLEAGDIAIFTNEIDKFVGSEGLAGKISKKIKRRIVMRPNPEIVMDKEATTAVINELVPETAEISELFFDPCIWKVIIQCKNPSEAVAEEEQLPEKFESRLDGKFPLSELLQSSPKQFVISVDIEKQTLKSVESCLGTLV